MGLKSIDARVSPPFVVAQLCTDREYLLRVKSITALHYLPDALRVKLISGALLAQHCKIIILQHLIIFSVQVAVDSKNSFAIDLKS